MHHHPMIHFDEIDSTNTYLKDHYQDLDTGTIVRANFQTKGRGQFDRTWQSRKGDNLLFSILFKGDLGFPVQWMNPIIVSTLISVLKDNGIDAYYEEPNDIFIEGQKVAGILIETKYQHELTYLVLGVGLNVNQLEFGALDATSLAKKLGKPVDLDAVFKKILGYLDHNLLLMRLIADESKK